jgi:hypothetical protein
MVRNLADLRGLLSEGLESNQIRFLLLGLQGLLLRTHRQHDERRRWVALHPVEESPAEAEAAGPGRVEQQSFYLRAKLPLPDRLINAGGLHSKLPEPLGQPRQAMTSRGMGLGSGSHNRRQRSAVGIFADHRHRAAVNVDCRTGSISARIGQVKPWIALAMMVPSARDRFSGRRCLSHNQFPERPIISRDLTGTAKR